MTGMKRAATGILFSATLALSLLASTGQAFAASLDTRDGAQVVAGQGSTPKTASAPSSPLPGGFTALGISWE